ncbi:MAG: glycoside hydrolase family 3 C-terminal domain-containing protein [Acidimicrobiia bacterium]|nr:glycoside hydrolase family 3 C-terminal domain-containing protein [Acidimicrobiia bacterium]
MRRRLLGLFLAVAAVATVTVARASTSTTPSCPWLMSTASTNDKVAMVMAAMTTAEKIGMVHGVTQPAQSIGLQPGAPPYVGVVPAVPRLCIPSIKLEDGPAGVGDGMKGVTQLPAPVAAAASWDTDLMKQYGGVLGAEQWAKGANVVLAPTVNIVRDPRWGRAFEAFSEDPYLSAAMGVADIEGIQAQGPMAQVKHLAAYNEETFRDTVLNNVVVDPRTLHEVYLRSFDAAANEAHVGSVMCAYNELNGVRDCENPYLMDQVLKGEMGFPGFVTSDWFAIQHSAAAVDAGLDMQMPDSCLLGDRLSTGIADGTVTMGVLNEMVRRILRELFTFNLFTTKQTGTPKAVVTSPEHAALARTAAEEGTVLLKNAAGVLPLDAKHDKSIAVIGSDAGPQAQTAGGGSAAVVAPYVVTPEQAIAKRAAKVGASVTYDDGSNPASAAVAARKADVAIVFASLFTEEDRDQSTLDLPANENALVAAVSAANPNTVVVLNSGSAVVMPWVDQVKGVVESWYPGQEDGNAVAAVLFGDVNPSGKLPVTFPSSQALMPTSRPDRWPGIAGQVQYSEGLDVGYRWYDDNHVDPAFPFGFGLSYTSFSFGNLHVSPTQVTVDVTNTGERPGADVVQLYVTQPKQSGEPPRQLAGFQRVELDPHRTKTVTVPIDRRSLSFWDPGLHRWKELAGSYTVEVGDSSRNLPWRGQFTVDHQSVWGNPTPPASTGVAKPPNVAATDLAQCWQDQIGVGANGGLSLTGTPSPPSNPSQVPVG